MGYMGFGMRKEVYQRKPRKPFEKSSIPERENARPAERSYYAAHSNQKGVHWSLRTIQFILYRLLPLLAILLILFVMIQLALH